MKKLLSLLLTLNLLFASGSHAEGEAGRVVAMQGDAEILGADGMPRAVAPGEPLLAQESLRTGPRSLLTLRMSDGSVLTLRASSQLKLKSYQAQAGRRAAAFHYALERGALHLIGGSGHMRLDSPVGALASKAAARLACALDSGFYCTLYENSATLSSSRGSLQLGGQADFDHGLVVTANSRPLGLLWLPWPLSQDESPQLGQTPTLPPRGSRNADALSNGLPAPRPIVITPQRRAESE